MYQKNKDYKKLSKEIEKIKTAEQVGIVGKWIESLETYRITYEEYVHLWSKLNNRASKIGERKLLFKLGPLGEFGIEKKGTICDNKGFHFLCLL